MFWLLILAPTETSSSTTLRWLSWAAAMRGVKPFCKKVVTKIITDSIFCSYNHVPYPRENAPTLFGKNFRHQGTGHIFANGMVLLENTPTKSPKTCIDRGLYLLPATCIIIDSSIVLYHWQNKGYSVRPCKKSGRSRSTEHFILAKLATQLPEEVRMSKSHKLKHHVGTCKTEFTFVSLGLLYTTTSLESSYFSLEPNQENNFIPY